MNVLTHPIHGTSPALARQVVVACAADERYALPLAVMLRSAERRLSPGFDLSVYAVDAGLSAEARDRVARSLGERIALNWLSPERAAFAGLPLWGRMPVATYDKLAIGRWLPPSVERAIWLDADLLVLGNLAELWATDLGCNVALAAQDDRVPTVASRFGVPSFAALGMASGAKYFNAGVMVIDLPRWRAAAVEQRALAYLKRHRNRVYFWDQEALNVALAERWGELCAAWNWNPSLGRLESGPCAGEARPRILHFSGYLKPWRYRSRSVAHELYYRDLDATEWAGFRPPSSWFARRIGSYESSRLRRFALPVERVGLSLVRAMTLRYVSDGDLDRTQVARLPR